MDAPNGRYEVMLTMGDEGALHDQMAVFLEGALVDTVTTPSGQYAIKCYLVEVADGQLTLSLVDNGGSNANVVINALEVTAAEPESSLTSVVLSQGLVDADAAQLQAHRRTPALAARPPAPVPDAFVLQWLFREGAFPEENAFTRRTEHQKRPVLAEHAAGFRDRFFTDAKDEAMDAWWLEDSWLNLVALQRSKRS